ncbi:MAG: phage holin family protein [Muribaculaceae bacterium]|nr:phage holin family protein [Muribaculaceae bacterium]
MKASGKIPQTIHTLADLTRRLISLYIENVKLTAAEKLTVVMSAGVILIITLVLGIFALAFVSGACIELLALVLPAWASYAILGGFFVLLVLLVLIFRKHLVVNPIARFVSKLVFDGSHNEKDGDDDVEDDEDDD